MRNPAYDAIEFVRTTLKMEPEWTEQQERGITWWASSHPTTLWYDPPFEDEGHTIYRLHATTPLIKGFKLTKQNMVTLNDVMCSANLSGLVKHPSALDRLQFTASIYVHEHSADWLKQLFALTVLLQARDAFVGGMAVSEHTGWFLDRITHPTNGLREKPALIPFTDLSEHSVKPNAWSPGEVPMLEKIVNSPPFVSGNVDVDGLTAELPYGDFTSLLQMKTTNRSRIGKGLRVSLALPLNVTNDSPQSVALGLNTAENNSFTHAYFLGSWCWEANCLAYVSFMPNFYLSATLVQNSLFVLK